jgi:hypothetical protein
MSKKATRRAARESFPKVPARGTKPAGTKSAGTKYAGSKSSAASQRKGRAAQALRPPSWKRAVIMGAVLAILYFVVIQYLWTPKDAAGNPTSNVWGSLLISFIGFVAYTLIAYFVDRFNYNRKMRKLKGSSK